MKAQIPPKVFSRVITALIGSVAKSATLYLAPNLVVRATWRHKPSGQHVQEQMYVTMGRPNYLEKAFALKARDAREPFPIKKIQFKAWPKKRKPK